VVAALRKEPGFQVELIDGNRGEFTVSVGSMVVAQKGEGLPSVEDVLNAVKQAAPAGAGA
jgi:hypothetical protein